MNSVNFSETLANSQSQPTFWRNRNHRVYRLLQFGCGNKKSLTFKVGKRSILFCLQRFFRKQLMHNLLKLRSSVSINEMLVVRTHIGEKAEG